MNKIITKYSGEQQPFDVEKFQRSLRRAGASESQIRELTRQVQADPSLDTTKAIYDYAYGYLRTENPPIAARYSLRTAISELGPSGFPFEQFMAEVFRRQGYTAYTDQMMNGLCVSHEIDLVLQKGNDQAIAECKFHHEHLKVDVKVPLYFRSRFEDLNKAHKNVYQQAWVITNTKFTSEAEIYGQCAGLNMLSWSFPINNSLARIIDRLGLHPITSLTTLSGKQKQMLLGEKLVMVQDVYKELDKLRSIGLSQHQIDAVVQEANKMRELGAIDNHEQAS